MGDPQSECEELMNAAIPFTVQMPEGEGKLNPYAAERKADGDVLALGAELGEERPSSGEVLEIVEQACAEGARS